MLSAIHLLGKEEPQKKNVFSPNNFNEYIGQSQTKQLLKIAIDAASKQNRPLPNILLVGGFGLGKTTLARLTYEAAGIKPRILDGASADKEPPKSGNVIIDEVHNLSSGTSDILNGVLDNSSLHVIAATTNPGLLSAAFRSRFRIYTLSRYSDKDLTQIAQNICLRRNIGAASQTLLYIAKRARSNPRQLTNFLDTMFDVMVVDDKYTLDRSTVDKAFNLIGVDSKGLLPRDREYLDSLPDRPVGLGFLSALLGVDRETIEEEIEPYLLQMGLIDRTPKGRVKI